MAETLRHPWLRWTLVGALTAGLGYIALRQYSVAYCGQNRCGQQEDPMQQLVADLMSSVDQQGELLWLKMKQALFTQPILNAFDVIKDVVDRLKSEDLNSKPYNTPLFILLGLIKRVQGEAGQGRHIGMTTDELAKLKHSFPDSRRMGHFALNVYDASLTSDPADAARKLGVDHAEHLLFIWFSDDGQQHCPKFAIFLDTASESVVLAIRGTFSFADAVVDVVCVEEPFLDGFAHRGILAGARKILQEGGHVLKEAMDANPSYRLVVTGHSLGAGTAELITMELLSGKHEFFDARKRQLKCVALAPPPVYRGPMPPSLTDHIEIFVNNDDAVPRLSLALVAKLLAIIRAVDAVPLSPMEAWHILSGSQDPAIVAKFDQIKSAVHSVQQLEFSFLDHPASSVFHLLKPDDPNQPYQIHRKPSHWFSHNLILLESMIKDHLQPYYRQAFGGVKLD